MKTIILKISFLGFLFLFGNNFCLADSGNVVINEIAWMGTENSANDEWIELYNNSDSSINLDGWRLEANDGSPKIELTGTVLSNSFYLLERTDDDTLPEISADLIYTSAIGNNGENLKLFDNQNNLIDQVNCSDGWFAGDNQAKQTMERVNPLIEGNNSQNWQNSQNSKGTPKEENSSGSKDQNLVEPEKESEDLKDSTSTTNLAPTVEAGDDIVALVGQIINFDGTKSSDPEDDTLNFLWNFGDGNTSAEQNPSYTFQYPGTYIVNLIVSDGRNSSSNILKVDIFLNCLEISEFLPNPKGPDSQEWIEVYNNSEGICDISSWQLDDEEKGSNPFSFPENTFIFPHQYLVVPRSISGIALNNNKDICRLFYPTGQLSQEIIYQEVKEGWSVAKSDQNFFWTQFPSPGLQNIINSQAIPLSSNPSFSEVQEIPSFSLNSSLPSESTTKTASINNVKEQGKELSQDQLTATLKKSSNPLVVIIIATLIAILSGFGIFFLKKKTEKI